MKQEKLSTSVNQLSNRLNQSIIDGERLDKLTEDRRKALDFMTRHSLISKLPGLKGYKDRLDDEFGETTKPKRGVKFETPDRGLIDRTPPEIDVYNQNKGAEVGHRIIDPSELPLPKTEEINLVDSDQQRVA